MEQSLKWIRRAVAALFAALTLWTAYWSVVAGPFLSAHPRNLRRARLEAEVEPGGIYARGGEALSVTGRMEDGPKRIFVGPDSLAHTVGYRHPRFGKAGLEAALDAYLTGGAGATGLLPWWLIPGGRRRGWDVVTTLHLPLQEEAARALGGRTGAVVVMDPRDGAVLAMVSEPGFDPDRLESYLEEGSGAGAPLFNRATQGQYPPGSVFKPVVLAAALEAGLVGPDTVFWDTGSVRVGGRTIRNAGGAALGAVGLDEALAHSSNAVFASLGAALGAGELHDFAARLGIGRRPGIEIAAAPGRLPAAEELDDEAARAEVSIGQGALLVTPLQMAVVASAVANGGYKVEPTLVLAVRPPGQSARQLERAAPVRVMSQGTARVVKEAMVAAVLRGTAREVEWPGARAAAGKTGTAENPHGQPHAWFIGFYPADEPEIAVAVVVENGGFGSVSAVPVARSLFAAWDWIRASGR